MSWMKAGAMLNRWAIILQVEQTGFCLQLQLQWGSMYIYIYNYMYIYIYAANIYIYVYKCNCVYIYIILSLSKWDEPPSRVAFFLHSNRDACPHCQESFMADVVYTFKQTKINHKQERPIWIQIIWMYTYGVWLKWLTQVFLSWASITYHSFPSVTQRDPHDFGARQGAWRAARL